MVPEVGFARAGGKAEVLASTLGVEPGRYRKRLHQRGFAGAIVTGQQRHPRVEIQPATVSQRGDDRYSERIPGHPNALGLELNPPQEPAPGWRDRPANRCTMGIHPVTVNMYLLTKERRMDAVAADQEWLGWLQGLLTSGAEALGAELVGEPVLGLRGRSIGCRAATSGGEWWLRVVTEPACWACGPAWTGTSMPAASPRYATPQSATPPNGTIITDAPARNS